MATVHLVVLLTLVSFISAEPLVVKTSEGLIRGFTSTSRDGKEFLAFTGIPFAKPPVGDLRFQPPQEPDQWQGIRNSTAERPTCLQFDSFTRSPKVVGVEDCLYLSVFTHKITGSRPVMVHIHGGGFVAGAGLNVDQMKFLMDQNVVIVDIQYRVGIMGFLSFQDAELPGNMGLKDQTMALRWVKKNIAKFGGNPGKVTIFGESAGGASVYYHTISPLSKGLFHRAISESGTTYNPWALVPPELAISHAKRLAEMMSCPTNSTKEAVECLRNQNGEKLVSQLTNFRVWEVNPLLAIQPVMEPPSPEAFLSGPESSWVHSRVPLLIGMTSGEGLLMTSFFIQYNMDFSWFNDNFKSVAPISMLYNASTTDPDKVTEKVRQFYFGDRPISMNEWVNLTNAYTDSLFGVGAMEGADKHRGNVYFYYFAYMGNFTTWTTNTTLAFATPHAGEVVYLWWAGYLKGQDLALSYDLIKIWTHFADTGVATVPNQKATWKKWKPKRHDYMHITNSGFKAEVGLLDDRYKFWMNLKM
nr:esterase FE4 [Halyomorpha halys]